MRISLGSILLFLLPVALLMGFQNCSSQVPFGSINGIQSKLVEGELFAYEANFDQIAYMSCSEQEDVFPDPQTFFTFRVGAYRNSGLRIVDEFFDETEKMQNDEKINILSQQLISAGTRMQFAVRSAENFQLAFINEQSGTEGVDGSDFQNVFTTMGDESLSAHLLRQPRGTYMNIWTGAPFESQYRFEASLHFEASELIQNEMRSFLSRQGILALTFSEEGTINPRGPGYITGDAKDLRRNVFGSAVQMRFRQPSPAEYENAANTLYAADTTSTDMPPRLLSAVQEVAIDGRSKQIAPKAWICPPELALRIVLPQHAAAQGCVIKPDDITQSETLKAARQSLYVEDWYIDLANRCAIPKEDRVRTGVCYGINSNTSTTHQIQYDFSQPCGIGTGNGVCPHFVSICVRE